MTLDSALGEGTTVTCFFPVRASPSHDERGRLTMADRGDERTTRRPRRSICLDEAATHRARAMARRASLARATSLRFPAISAPERPTFARALSPGGDRRARARGAEPDLHADAGLRGPGLSRRACRFLSLARRRGARPTRLGGDDRGRRRAGRMAGARRRRLAAGSTGNRAVLRSPRGATNSAARELRARGAMAARFKRARAIEALLERAGWAEANRAPLHGDASSRAYERLTARRRRDGDPDDLAAAPERPDAAFRQVLRGDRAGCRPTSAPSSPWRGGLRAQGYSTPRILAHRRHRRSRADRGFRR